ncbi:MAG: class C sortase [Oscillospiraceae bacterium]|nr:class C sortase [Oscillospiraceae bacterium]
MKKGRIGTIAIILVFVAGLSLLLYPTVSNYWNSRLQSQVIVDYSDSVSKMNQELYERLRAEAEVYNRVLAGDNTVGTAGDYDSVLDPAGNGVMGYVEIPTIGCTLPIAHGTSDSVLKDSVGHLDWSSMPVGGIDTHSVISAHRGLPSAELFTNIDQLVLGDRFYIHVLGEKLEYKVDKINVVEPHDVSTLTIEKGRDLVTLVTCTPYGINSHRLLVRGTRVDLGGGSDWERIELPGEAREVPVAYPIIICMTSILIIMFVVLILFGRKGRKEEEQ